jgi:hypothetical protein
MPLYAALAGTYCTMSSVTVIWWADEWPYHETSNECKVVTALTGGGILPRTLFYWTSVALPCPCWFLHSWCFHIPVGLIVLTAESQILDVQLPDHVTYLLCLNELCRCNFMSLQHLITSLVTCYLTPHEVLQNAVWPQHPSAACLASLSVSPPIHLG